MVMSHDLFAQITGPIEEELRLEREGTVTYEAQCAKLSELQQIHGLEHNEVRTTLRLIQAIWERTDDTQTITTPPQLRKIAGRDYDDAFKETLYFHVTCANPSGSQTHLSIPVTDRYGETLLPKSQFNDEDAALVSRQLFHLEALHDTGELPDLSDDLGKIIKKFRPSNLGSRALGRHDN